MNQDVYFGGSEMQAMARLIHIAKVKTMINLVVSALSMHDKKAAARQHFTSPLHTSSCDCNISLPIRHVVVVPTAQALEATAAAQGSSLGPSFAAAAAANVTNALRLLLEHKLTLPCTEEGPNAGALCYDSAFKTIATARALRVSAGGDMWADEGLAPGQVVVAVLACHMWH